MIAISQQSHICSFKFCTCMNITLIMEKNKLFLKADANISIIKVIKEKHRGKYEQGNPGMQIIRMPM